MMCCLFSCAGAPEPPQELPQYLDGEFKSGTQLSFVDLKIEQEKEKLTGRYKWSRYGSSGAMYGDFSGTTAIYKSRGRWKHPDYWQHRRDPDYFEEVFDGGQGSEIFRVLPSVKEAG